ncbi:cold-shock protein [Streptomyces canus]|uniref:cold-shock protein n=1 Tax=Streptomyces canus TaxID=58343 RepID=UPI003711632B
MAEGTVKSFNSEEGYGWLTPDGWGRFSSPPRRSWWSRLRGIPAPAPRVFGDVRVHYSEIQMKGYKTLEVGWRVSFDIVWLAEGPQAIRVTPLE